VAAAARRPAVIGCGGGDGSLKSVIGGVNK